MLEMKVIVALTARRFDFRLGYEGLDRAGKSKGVREVYGERGYQVQRAQPQGDLPCFVALVDA